MARPKSNQTSADFCREMNWDVGQTLIGHDVCGPSVIQITAIGERYVLAKTIFPDQRSEITWVLNSRDWQPVETY